MAHWDERDSWLSSSLSCNDLQCELWHGERFRALAGFWDPTQYTLLPSFCTACSSVISAEQISLELDTSDDTNPVQVQCPQCATRVRLIP